MPLQADAITCHLQGIMITAQLLEAILNRQGDLWGGTAPTTEGNIEDVAHQNPALN